jgi:hypothetical protein
MLGALLNLYVGDKLGRIKTLYVYVHSQCCNSATDRQRRHWYNHRNYPSSSISHLWHDDLCQNLQRYFQRNVDFNGTHISIRMLSTREARTRRHDLCHRQHLVSWFHARQMDTLTSYSGLMCSYWIGLAFYYTEGQISWRFPVTFQCVFTFAMYALLSFQVSQLIC